MEDERLVVNRQNWNERTPVHAATAFYDVEGFKAGRITLTDVERREVGDVDGKTLLHLQCHFGLDTMSWARLGAKATGVDFSDAAIDLARSLNDDLELNTRSSVPTCTICRTCSMRSSTSCSRRTASWSGFLISTDGHRRSSACSGRRDVLHRRVPPFVDAVEVSESDALHATYGYFHREVSIQETNRRPGALPDREPRV